MPQIDFRSVFAWPACSRILHNALRVLFLSIAIVGAAGCATSEATSTSAESSASKTPTTKKETAAPGTQGWEESAESLPSESPVVMTIYPNRLFANADALRQWVFAEPAMFGDDGAAMVSRWRKSWRALVGRTGGNPLDSEMLESLAIDTSRPIHAGLYPTTGGGQTEYIDAVDRVIRDRFEVEDDEQLLESLRSAQKDATGFPGGLYESAERATADIEPNMGGRIAVPTIDDEEFVGHLTEMAELAGYSRFDSVEQRLDVSQCPSSSTEAEDATSEEVVGLHQTGSRWPGILVRPCGEVTIVDVLYRPFEPPRASDVGVENQLKSALAEAVRIYPSGRPQAPAPRGLPIATISADQSGTAHYIRLLGYMEAVGAVGTTAVERRDKLFTGGVMSTLMTDGKWSVASNRLTGVTYALTGTLGSADRLFRVDMTVFGSPPDEALSLSSPDISLGVEDRSMAASIDLKPLFDSSWQQWLAVEDPSALLQMGEAAATRPLFTALAMPRNAAIAFVNADRIPSTEFPDELQKLHEYRRSLGRFEIATSGIDVRHLRSHPKVATLLTLDGSTNSELRHEVFRAITPVLNGFVDAEESDFDEDDSRVKETGANGETPKREYLEELAHDSLVALPSRPGKPAVRYFASSGRDVPFFMMTYGLSDRQASGELDNAQDGESPASVESLAYARLEPAALFSLVSAADLTPSEPIDTGILAQRIGALTLRATSKNHGDFQTLKYSFTLQAPPEL